MQHHNFTAVTQKYQEPKCSKNNCCTDFYELFCSLENGGLCSEVSLEGLGTQTMVIFLGFLN